MKQIYLSLAAQARCTSSGMVSRCDDAKDNADSFCQLSRSMSTAPSFNPITSILTRPILNITTSSQSTRAKIHVGHSE